jgi:hypothetical protein
MRFMSLLQYLRGMSNGEGEEFRKKIRDARHESVTPDLLGKGTGGVMDARLNDGALILHLRSDEQPHFIFRGRKKTPEVYGSISPSELSRSRRHKVFHVVTDERWLCVVGNSEGDQRLSIPLETIEEANYKKADSIKPDIASRFSRWEVAIETELGFVQIPIIDDINEEDFHALSEYLGFEANVTIGEIPVDSDEAGYTIDGVETYEPSERTIADLLDKVPPAARDEADEIVREADDAADLVRDLKSLIDEYEDENQSINDVVAGAQGADDLRRQVASKRDKVRTQAEKSFEEVQTTIKESDPEEVSKFAVQTANAAAPVIRYASRTNLALLGTLLTAGAVGARKSSDQPSIFDELDSHQLAATANAMATRGGEIHEEEAKGKAVGAILGMSSQMAKLMAPGEYAKWVTQADPEAIMQGAEKAAKLNMQNGRANTATTRLAGGSLGLLYGYTGQGEMNDVEML